MAEVQLTHHEIVNDLLLLQWSDGSEHALPLASLRKNCPCAACAGEKDVFGNVYKGPEIKLVDNAFKLINVIKVGNYAIRITWGDMHSDGIYTFEYLRKLDLSE